MPHTPAQHCETDDICLVKMSSMCDKYCITENELYSLLEWFIIQKMLIKKQDQSQRLTQTLRHIWQEIALEMST